MSVDLSGVIGDGYLYDVVTDLKEMNSFDKAIQFSSSGATTASSEATFIFSAPPVLHPKKPFKRHIENYLQPLGAIQQYGLNQGTQIIPFPELGSRLKRQAMGSGNYGASLTRVDAKHSNLKWSLYSWLPSFLEDNVPGYTSDRLIDLALLPAAQGTAANGDLAKHFVGLESDLFKIPFGLLCISGSAGGKVIHIEFLEACYIQGNNRGAQAGSPMITPTVSLSVTRPVPYTDRSTGENMLSSEAQKALRNLKATKTYSLAAPTR